MIKESFSIVYVISFWLGQDLSFKAVLKQICTVRVSDALLLGTLSCWLALNFAVPSILGLAFQSMAFQSMPKAIICFDQSFTNLHARICVYLVGPVFDLSNLNMKI